MVSNQKQKQLMKRITLTAADSISYPDHPYEFFSVPNDRIGTELEDGEGYILGSQFTTAESSIGDPTKEQVLYIKKEFPPDSDGFIPKPEKALTYDDGKPPLGSLPWKALREVAMVQAYGAKKYEPYNWKRGMESTRNASCAIRHIADYLDGNDKDHESGRHALAHAACRILFLLENIIDDTVKDDRYKQP